MLVNNFLLPLLATLVIEVIAAYTMGYRDKQTLAVILLANAMTNPVMNFIAALIIYAGLRNLFYWIIVPLELLVIPIEWMILYYAIPNKKTEFLKLSAVMNISSFVIGLVLF